jgi:hypothetical protein
MEHGTAFSCYMTAIAADCSQVMTMHGTLAIHSVDVTTAAQRPRFVVGSMSCHKQPLHTVQPLSITLWGVSHVCCDGFRVNHSNLFNYSILLKSEKALSVCVWCPQSCPMSCLHIWQTVPVGCQLSLTRSGARAVVRVSDALTKQ